MHTPASRFPVELTWEGKSKRKLKTKLAGFEFGVSFIIHVVAKSELVGNILRLILGKFYINHKEQV